MRKVYADNAATTRVLPEVAEKMMKYLVEDYGNPSSLYEVGRKAHSALSSARETIAKCLGANADEIIFTSGGSQRDTACLVTYKLSASVCCVNPFSSLTLFKFSPNSAITVIPFFVVLAAATSLYFKPANKESNI